MKERDHWKDYMEAYEEMIQRTTTEDAPWHVVPADHKWFTRLVVSEVVVDALESQSLAYPEVDEDKRKELAALRKSLAASQ